MDQSMGRAAQTTPDRTLVSPRPVMAKAGLPQACELSSVVKEAARRAHGKQGIAAAALGKDEGNFSRDVVAGRVTLNDMHRLGPEFLAELGRELVEQFGPLATPGARLRQQVRTMRASLDEIEQAAELIA